MSLRHFVDVLGCIPDDNGKKPRPIRNAADLGGYPIKNGEDNKKDGLPKGYGQHSHRRNGDPNQRLSDQFPPVACTHAVDGPRAIHSTAILIPGFQPAQ